MGRFLLLILVALLCVIALLFLFNPHVLADVWMWIIGLIGPIVAAARGFAEWVAGLFKRDEEPDKDRRITHLTAQTERLERELRTRAVTGPQDDFKGRTLSVMRYIDDGDTTLGLLFLDDRFFCYTLEDGFREPKIPKETRIPKGNYVLDFRRQDTDLTKRYRESRPWFEYHLQIKNVPDFTSVYIHCGNDHTHTEGCLLVADRINASDASKMILNSRATYRRLYEDLKKSLDAHVPVRIKLFDENWFQALGLTRRDP